MTNSSNPLVTIGIPTYNRAGGNLSRVIERALEQTYPNVEVIVSDNCSTDQTPELVQSIKDPRLRYFRQETNIGPHNNFTFCLKQARGEYFLLFHDDDMIDKDFVEACISSLEQGQTVGVILTGVRIIDEHGNVFEEHENGAAGLSPVEFILGWFKGKTSLYLCSTLYNTNWLREAGGFSSKKNLYNDLVPTFTLATRFGRADVKNVKASFRRHRENRGGTISIHDWVEDSVYLLETVCQLLPDECDVLSKEGGIRFCKKMYRYASDGRAVTQSPMDYLRIYKSFNYCYSPLSYWYSKKLGRKISQVKRALAGQ